MLEERDKEDEYKDINFSYSVSGEDNRYGGTAWIHLHFRDASQDICLVLNKEFDTLDEAESAIINSVKCWIDTHSPSKS